MADASLSNRVYDEILGRIMSGRMKPGDVFNRRQIAAELSVSVAPVLEAMLELESEGLIETLPRRGTRVCSPHPREVWGQLMVREALECQAARLYHGEIIRRHLPRLSRLAADLDALDSSGVDYAREEIRFHHYLVSLAACPTLTSEFERVLKIGVLHAAHLLVATTDPATDDAASAASLVTHSALVQALLTTDAETAESSIRLHLRCGREALFQAIPPDEHTVPSLPPWLGSTNGE